MPVRGKGRRAQPLRSRQLTHDESQVADLVAYVLNRLRRIQPKLRRPADIALRGMLDEHVAPAVRTYRQTWPWGPHRCQVLIE